MRNPEFGNFSQLIRVGSHGEVVFGENFMYNAKGELHNVVPHVLKLSENEHCWSMHVKPSDGEETADRFIYSKPEYHCEVLC